MEVGRALQNNPLVTADSYWLLNGHVTLFADGGGWEIKVWAKNLTDEVFVVQGLDVTSLGFRNRGYNAPRTYGVTLSKHFD